MAQVITTNDILLFVCYVYQSISPLREMKLLVCVIFLYFSAAALASSVPTLDLVTHAASATTTAAPSPTTSMVQYRTVTCFSTRAAYGDLERHVAVDFDSPVFRKRLYSDRLSFAANYANAREITMAFLKTTARQVGEYLLTLDYGTIGNIVFRAAVRSLTPGYELQLLDTDAWQQVTSDVAAITYMQGSFPQLPASPSAVNINALDLQLPTQLPSLTDLRWGVKYMLAHLDASALISLGLRAVVTYLDLDVTIDTAEAMALVDAGMHIAFRSRASVPQFHKFGDVLKSLDTVFPSLELSSLVSGLPHPPLRPFEPAEDSLPRSSISFTPTPPSYEMEKEPFVVTVYFSETPAPRSETRFGNHEQRDADPHTKGLGEYITFEDPVANNIIRDALHIVIAILATGGVVISTMKMIDGFRKAEQAKQDLIKLHALKSLAYLSWNCRKALLKTLATSQSSRLIELAPDYELAIAPDVPEAQIVAHVIRLVCALSPERRQDFTYALEIASLPLPPLVPTLPDPVDPIQQIAPSPISSSSTEVASTAATITSAASPPPPSPPPPSSSSSSPPPPPSSSSSSLPPPPPSSSSSSPPSSSPSPSPSSASPPPPLQGDP